MQNEPHSLPLEAAIEINRTTVAMTGERHLVRDPGLLEGALARPQHAFAYGEDDIATLAVRLMAGIAQSHPFEQGNKRTAFIAMIQFLNANGHDLAIDDSAAWAAKIIAFVEHRLTEDDFVALIRPFVVPRD